MQFLEQEPASSRRPRSGPEERAVAHAVALETHDVGHGTLFHRPAAPPLEELPTARRARAAPAPQRELRPAADQSNGPSYESDGADSMSDDASFIHGDDDPDSNGTLSPIPSGRRRPSFMMRPSIRDAPGRYADSARVRTDPAGPRQRSLRRVSSSPGAARLPYLSGVALPVRRTAL